MRHKGFSVSIKDCIVQTFTVGGHGGSGKDTSNTGVRVIHPPSGARGEGREERSQLKNKRQAFVRMAATKTFQNWVKLQYAKQDGLEDRVQAAVNEAMQERNIKIEAFVEGKWQRIKDDKAAAQ